jgi:glycosyltransferase involved in cell wall biosynthesis
VGYDFAKPTKIYAAAACGTPVVFAGNGAGAELVSANRLGWRADYNAESVAEAMIAAARHEASGGRKLLAPDRSRWVSENASLEAIGKQAAATALQLIPEK